MELAHHLASKHLPRYASRFSRRDFTQPQLFACLVLRQFYNLSYRRAEALLRDCPDLRHAVGLGPDTPDHNTLCDAFDRLAKLDAFAPMLDELAAAFEAEGLLRLDERPVAADSSHYESHHVSRHFERRRRRSREDEVGEAVARSERSATARGLPKLGIAVACACHLVLSLWAGTGAGGDHPHFETLAYHAWRRVSRSGLTFVADAGYDGDESHRLVRLDLNCTAVIPPLIGRPSEAGPASPFRAEMRRLFDGPKDAGLRRAYGQRWQVETVNSMMKRNYGSALRARTPGRREREMMLKVVVHNLAL
jgi:IS5 family transposase